MTFRIKRQFCKYTKIVSLIKWLLLCSCEEKEREELGADLEIATKLRQALMTFCVWQELLFLEERLVHKQTFSLRRVTNFDPYKHSV